MPCMHGWHRANKQKCGVRGVVWRGFQFGPSCKHPMDGQTGTVHTASFCELECISNVFGSGWFPAVQVYLPVPLPPPLEANEASEASKRVPLALVHTDSHSLLLACDTWNQTRNKLRISKHLLQFYYTSTATLLQHPTFQHRLLEEEI